MQVQLKFQRQYMFQKLMIVELIEEYLTIKRGSKVWIKVPQKGQKKRNARNG